MSQNFVPCQQDAADLQFIEKHYYGDVEPNSIIKVVPQVSAWEFIISQ